MSRLLTREEMVDIIWRWGLLLTEEQAEAIDQGDRFAVIARAQAALTRAETLKEVGDKWDSLYRYDAWRGLSNDETMWRFDQYIQGLTLPLRLSDKFPQHGDSERRTRMKVRKVKVQK